MYGIAPWQDPDMYTSLVPLYHVPNVHAAVLLAVGDSEAAVLPTIEMFNALRYLKRDVTLLRYRDEGHGLTPAADDDLRERMRVFFKKFLG
jgi:dipeptidyl aminopeptidase/acylaminoacyl peptidase